YVDDDELDTVGSTTFGETIPLYRDHGPWDGLWEIGLQAGVFAVFDLEAPSGDLVNADYLGGGTFAYRKANFSTRLRLYGGGGVLLRREPEDIDRFSSQGGAELDLPVGLPIRPLLAVDVQNRQESDWNTDFSGRAGFELENFQ